MEFLEERINLPNKPASLQRTVNLHGVITLEDISQVLDLWNPWQWISIKENRSNVQPIPGVLGKDNALGFRFHWIRIRAELQILLPGKFGTSIHHFL